MHNANPNTLLQVTATDAAAKLEALARVRDAFVFREGSSPTNPTAAEYILNDACRAGRRFTTEHAKRGASATWHWTPRQMRGAAREVTNVRRCSV